MGFFKPNVDRMRKKGDVQSLINLLDDKDLKVRQLAIKALGEIGDRLAIVPLCSLLPEISVAMALEKIGNTLTDRLYERAINFGPDDNDQKSDIDALSKIGVPVIDLLFSKMPGNDSAARLAAEEIEARLAARGMNFPSFSLLGGGGELWRDNRGACEAVTETLIKIGAPAIDSLCATLKGDNRNKYVRKVAAKALGLLGDARAIESLNAALNDQDGIVREAVAKALSQIDGGQAKESSKIDNKMTEVDNSRIVSEYYADKNNLAKKDVFVPNTFDTEKDQAKRESIMDTKCSKCGSKIDHFSFSQSDAMQVFALRGQLNENERRHALMRSVGGTCPKCGKVYCSKCYYDQKYTCPNCSSKIPELGGN